MYAKSLLVLLCAGLLAASSVEPRRAYRSGHEYSYEYNGQVASSMSNGEQYSASRFRTLVKLNFISDTSVVIQLENPQLGQWNDYLATPQELQKFDKFERVEIKSEHADKLALPFQIRFTNGKVSELSFHQEDSSFTENVKRAVINALQVQLESPDLTSEDRDLETYGFALNETTIEGDCESTYTVRKVRSESENIDAFNVTKSVNFAQCRYRPEQRYNYFRYAEPMEFARRERMDDKTAQRRINSNPALDISSVYDFAITGDRRQFVVKEGQVVSRYSYELMDAERVQLVTWAVAKMTLKNVERKESSSDMLSTKSPVSLVYDDALDILKERFIAEGDEAYLRQNPYMPMSNVPSIISHIMKRLVETSTKDTVEGIDEEATRYLSQLVSILRLSSRSDIEKIHQELFENDKYDARQRTFVQGILADAMAIAGTRNSITHLFSKIENGDISSGKASQTLLKLMNVRLVSSDTTRDLQKLCKTSRVQESTPLKRTCWLTYGALVNSMCRMESPLQHSDKYTRPLAGKYCDVSTKNDITKDAIDFFRRASTRADRILALKTIGNMGLETHVNFLEEIIRDWNVEKVIRIQAIDALRQMRAQIPRKIQRILLPVFQNRREHPEIRMNAVYQLLHTRPEKAILDQVMTEMIREPNTHVKSFLNQLAFQMAENAQDLYDRETAQTLRSMLKHFKLYSDEEKTTPLTSKFLSSVVSVDQRQLHDLASQLNLAALFSNDSRLPKEVMASMNLLANNRLIPNAWQVGAHTQDLESLLERLMAFFESKDLDDLVKRGRRSVVEEYNPVKLLKSFFNKMKIATRRVTSETSDPMILLYTRWFDMDTIFCLTDEESLPQLLKAFIVDGQVDVSTLETKNAEFSWASAYYGHEQQIKTPMISGLPLLTTIRVPTIVTIDGTFSLNFGEKEDESRVRGVRVHLKAEPKIATTLIAKMEIFSPFFTSGVKTLHSAQVRLPLNVMTKAHAPNWWPEIEFHMPREEVRLMHLQTRPVTFYRIWPAKSGVFIEAVEKTLIIEEATTPLKERKISYSDPFMGMNINIDAHWHSSPLRADEKVIGNWLLAGENAVEIKLQPTADSNKILKLTLHAKTSSSDDLRSLEIPDFQTLFGRHTEQMFAEAEQDELRLIKDQMKHASSKLVNSRHVTFKIEALKGARTHVAKVDLKSLCDDRMVLCVLTHHIDVDSEWTFKANAQLAMPELRGIVGVPSRHIVSKVDIKFGSGEKSELSLNLYGRPSYERIQWIKRWLNSQSEKRIESDSQDLFEKVPQRLQANDIVMITEAKLTPEVSRALEALYTRYVPALPFVALPERELLRHEASKRSSTIMTRLILDSSAYNLTLTVPNKGRLEFTSGDASSPAETLMDVLRSTHGNDAECLVKKDFLQTFDGKKMKLPMVNCYTMLAKDCVEEPKYAVLARRVDKYRNELKLKMITDKVYELYLEDSKMVIMVDNYRIPQAQYDQYNIFKVGGENEKIYEIRCQTTGASIRFDGYQVITRIPSEYLHRQCGVCGHYNNDYSDDLRKHDNEEAENLQDFHQSYLYRGEECDSAAIEAISKEESRKDYSEDLEDMEYNNSENIDPVQKTMTMEDHNKICFSARTLARCPEGSRPSKTETETVDFVCLRRGTPKTRALLRRLEDNDTVTVPDEPSLERPFEVAVHHSCGPKRASAFSRRHHSNPLFL